MDVRPIVLDFRSRMTLSFSCSFEVFVVPTESHNDGGRDTRGFNVAVHSAGKYLSCPRDTLHAQRVLQNCLSSNSPAFLPSGGRPATRTAAIIETIDFITNKSADGRFRATKPRSRVAQIIFRSPDSFRRSILPRKKPDARHNRTEKAPQIYRSLRRTANRKDDIARSVLIAGLISYRVHALVRGGGLVSRIGGVRATVGACHMARRGSC